MYVCMTNHYPFQALQNIVLAILTGLIYLQLNDDANAIINRFDCFKYKLLLFFNFAIYNVIWIIMYVYQAFMVRSLYYYNIASHKCVYRSGALFFAIICNMFAATSSLELFITERALFM